MKDNLTEVHNCFEYKIKLLDIIGFSSMQEALSLFDNNSADVNGNLFIYFFYLFLFFLFFDFIFKKTLFEKLQYLKQEQ